MRFERGNQYGKTSGGGRPKGSRNALDAFAYATVLAHVQHNSRDPAPVEFADSNLWKALEAVRVRDPREYLARIIAMLPKQVSFEHTSVRELADEELHQMIERLRAELRVDPALPAPKIIEHVN